MKTKVTVQAYGVDTIVADVEKMVKEDLKNNGVKINTIENLELYLKPVEKECYYVATTKTEEVISGKVSC